MTRIKNSLGSRVLALFLSFVMLFGLIPFNIISVYAIGDQYGTLSGITAGGTLTNADSSNATITYSSGAVLNWSPKNPSIGRNVDGWWIGVKMTAPESMKTESDFENVTYQRKNGSTWSEAKSFWTYKDSSNSADLHHIELWGVINEEKLNDALSSGTTIQYQWKFDWNADGNYEQLATLIIDPNNIVLKKDEATVYPSVAGLGTVTSYTEGVTVSNGTGNYAGADFSSSATLSWVAADPSIGRTADGWWVGLKMTAPNTLTTEDDFDGVTLKAKGSSNEWSSAMDFWACKDSSNGATSHFVGLWGLVTDTYLENAVANGRNVEYSWKFDWNKDGIYEQQVNLSIDPSKIILKDSENNQIYPTLGTVTTYTGGTVSGVTGHITVAVDETTLNWSPKNPAIGRNIDAWWVGIKVTAPDYEHSILQNSKYQRLDNSATEWTANKSFWNNKDSADSEAHQFIQMWVPLTPASLAKAQDDGVNLTTEYRFDWDNDGNYEQLISLIIVPSDSIVLNKVDQTGFGFNSNPNPLDQWAGATFTNTASGGQSTGSVTYKIVSDVDNIASIDKNTGTVTFSAAGTITVRATKGADDTYNEATAEYTVTAVRYPQTEFKFQTTNPGTVLYADGKTFENEALGGSGTGAIKYEIISGSSYAEINENTGVVTFIKAGTITVKATKAADAYYNATTATYNLIIDAGIQAPLSFNTLPVNNELVYKTSAYEDVISVIGGSGTGAIKYSITTGKDVVASITPDGKITTLKAGQFTVHVEKEGDGGYNAATPIEVTLEVVKANQTTFAFTYPTPAAVTYNENGNTFVNPAINGESTEAITYTIANAGGDDIVDVAANGTLTIKRAGEVTIRATKAADERYNAAQVEYTLVIQKADQSFSFADGNAVAKYYGIKSYKNEVIYTALTSKADGKGYGNGTVTYEVSGDVIGASVSTDGMVNFADSTLKAGTITVKAKKEADECYNEVEKEYTLTVSYLPTPVSSFSLSGEKRNDSGWYTGDVTITPATGYKVSYSNNLSTDDWADTVIYGIQGTNSTNIYLINDEGSITDAIAVNDLQIDKTDPTNIDITYSTSVLDKIIETVTFGIYKAPVTVTLTAKNVYSGIESFTYNYNGTDITVNKSDITFDDAGVATYSFTINPQYRGVVTMSVTSTSGRTVNFTGDKTLVVDTMAPEFIVPEYTFSNDQVREYNSIYYTQGETKVKFTITEANFDLSLKKADDEDAAPAPILTVNGVAQNVTWTQTDGTDEWVAEITLTGNGDYVVGLTYTDRSTNAMESYTKEVHIDNVAPAFEVTYDNNEARNENNYKADRTATVKVTEHNFKAEEVNLVVTAKDITGADVDISSKAYSDYAKVPANWTQSGDVWTLNTDGIKFDIDAIYSVTLDYQDLAENDTNTYTADFVIDKNISSDVTIEYSTSIIDKVLETITFGLYKGDVTVTVSAKDQTAGVEHFQIAYIAVDETSVGRNNSNKPTHITDPIPAVQDVSDKTLFTATFTITKEARGKVSVNLIDKTGNATDKADNYVVVADSIAPGLAYEWTFTDDQVREYNNIYYTKGETKVKFTITEANFDLSLIQATGPEGNEETAAPAPVLTVNDVAQNVTWTQTDGTDEWVTEITLNGNGDYVVGLTYTDRSTNAMDSYTKEVHIDNVAPAFEVTYDNNEARNENNYKADRTATVKVTEHNFKAEEVNLVVTAKDITADDSDPTKGIVDISSKAYSDYAKVSTNWKYKNAAGEYVDDVNLAANPDERYLVLPTFDIDAIYHVEMNYTDLAENDADTYTADFVIDKNISSDVTIEYSSSIIDKVLETITFGLYQGDVIVTVSAKDQTAGVEYFQITYTAVDKISETSVGRNNSNKATYTTEQIAAVQNDTDKTLFTATHTITKEARGKVSVNLIDKAGNAIDKAEEYVVVADTIVPGLAYEWTFTDDQVREYNNIYYTKGETKVKFTIMEANFDLSLKKAYGEDATPAPVLTVNGVAQNVTWTQTDGTDEWVTEITLNGNGDYVVGLTYTDRSTNAMDSYTKEVHIDNVAPAFEVTYDNNEARNENNYKADRTATVKITEHNFKAEEVNLVVTAKDITGADVDISSKAYSDYAKNPANWTQSGDVWTLKTLKTEGMKFDIDAIYHVEMNYTDLAENDADSYTADFVIDKTSPSNVKVEYSESILDKVLKTITFGFYQPSINVTVTAQDDTAGVEYFKITYTKQYEASAVNTGTYTTEELVATQKTDAKNIFTAEHTIPANARGTVSVVLLDKAGNGSEGSNSTIAVVDNITPTREVIYTPEKVLDALTLLSVDSYQEGDNSILYYKNKAVVTFKINEANFDLSLKKADDEDVAPVPVIKVNNNPVSVEWSKEGDVWTAVHTITGDGDYIVTMTYVDRSTNAMVDYTSAKIAIDSTAPTISVAYDPAEAVANEKFFNTNRSMTVTIDEHNFRAEDIVVNVTAKNATGNAIANEASVAKAISDYLRNRSNWTNTSDIRIATVPFTVENDAQYDVTIDYKDLIGNSAEQYIAPSFVIDDDAPSNLEISYSDLVAPMWNNVLNAITFGYYPYNPSVEVTMTAFDDISGVDFFTWTYTQEEGTSTTKNVSTRTVTIPTEEITYSADKKTATATFTLTGTDAEQFRGSISFTATDRAANESTKYDDNARINIVDTISPTRSVTYSGAKRVIDAKSLLDISPYEYKGENTNAILYYNDDATVTVKVNEANFYAKDIVIEDNGTKITPDNWTQSGDEWTATFTITDEGDHVVTMTYTDRSNNKMTNYESQLIVIDRTNPEITVDYKNSKIKNTVLDSENHNRQYLDDTQVATITINEHNFRPDDVVIKVKAKDIVGKNVATFSFDTNGNVNQYAEQGKSRDEWAKLTPFTDTVYTANAGKLNSAKCRRVGDTYRLEIEYANDANYTFDIEYTDLAGNKFVRSSDYFTVDKTAPKNLTVSYSTNVFEKVLESITFGYYNAQTTVTITAEDDTSGIYHYLYSYVKSEGVSGVNAELLDDAISNANITHDGAKSIATFKIPKYVLANDNQFNGTVRFTAFDRSENSTDKADTERIVVDNIKPTVSVTYNDPIRNANNISYYAGDADVKIDIHEANFYSEDVKVSVTRDGNNYPVTVKWTNNSVDDHTGTFTLTEDGDYIVSVIYSDRSGNAMENYQSNRITVDKTKPTISTSAIKNNSANKDEVYTFTITANDTNIDFETFKPELKALVKNESGNYTVKSIPLGDIKTIETGKTYSFTVQNLEEDAAYTLTCTVKDMSGNEFSSIKLDDGNEYETVRFSINRNGSAFAANKFTANLVEQYYVYSVEKDVVLEEINVDPIENYVVKLNGNVLEEGKDYTTSISNNDGEWSKRTYSIHKDLFNSEGEYSIVIESTDKAETKAYSDVKNLKIAFVVDQTPPVLTVSGVEDGGRYQIDEQPVTVIPTDDGGRLYSFKAVVLDSSGNPLTKDGKDISIRFDMSGEELLNYLEEHEGKIVFTIPEGLENQVQLICNDCAAKADGSTNEYSYTYKKVTVSQSGWVIFYANKPLFYGSIGGVVGVSGLATGLTIFFKKRKLVKTAK